MALTIRGQVYHEGATYSGAKVRLYNHSDRSLVTATTSGSFGYYTFTPLNSGPFFIVAIIDTPEMYNALIWSNVIPTDV